MSYPKAQDINEKILSLDYGEFKAEIITVDAQESYNGGVLVLVTGYLTGRDNARRKFTQTFFLAPQDKGYFVLNDIFRYVEDPQLLDANSVSVNDAEPPLAVEQGMRFLYCECVKCFLYQSAPKDALICR